jgi:hypothetical protein
MGWWSASVLGGDGPLDMMYAIERDILEISIDPYDNPDLWNTVAKRAVEENLRVLASDRVLEMYSRYEGADVAAQVLGVYVLKFGIDPNIPAARKILDRARQAAVTDGWAKEDSDRRQMMDGYIQQIDQYDGTPTVPFNLKSLMEKIGDAMANDSR